MHDCIHNWFIFCSSTYRRKKLMFLDVFIIKAKTIFKEMNHLTTQLYRIQSCITLWRNKAWLGIRQLNGSKFFRHLFIKINRDSRPKNLAQLRLKTVKNLQSKAITQYNLNLLNQKIFQLKIQTNLNRSLNNDQLLKLIIYQI